MNRVEQEAFILLQEKRRMDVRHINRLIKERDELQHCLSYIERMLTDLTLYLTSDKFAWPDKDYAHVRTDMLPRIEAIRFAAIERRCGS